MYTILYNILKNSHNICGFICFHFFFIRQIKFRFYLIITCCLGSTHSNIFVVIAIAYGNPHFIFCFHQMHEQNNKKTTEERSRWSNKQKFVFGLFFHCLCATDEKRKKWIWFLKRNRTSQIWRTQLCKCIPNVLHTYRDRENESRLSGANILQSE